MGIDMRTYGSALKLKTGTDEDLLVDVVKTALLDPEGYPSSDPYRMADLGEIEAATTLEALFAAFRQILVRDEELEIVGCFGYDDRHYDPEALFEALAQDLEDGSWYGYQTDNDERILHIRNGKCEVCFLEEYQLDSQRVAEWGARHFNAFTEVPFEETDSEVGKLTILARIAAGRDDLLEAVPAPQFESHLEPLQTMNEHRPYQLVSNS